MKKILIILSIVFVSYLFFLLSASSADEGAGINMPEVEKWQLIPCLVERVVYNGEYGSGLVCRQYIDPEQKYCCGATWSVFYGDGTEVLYWKAWELNTVKAQTASLCDDGTWFVTPPCPMVFLINGQLALILEGLKKDDPNKNIDQSGRPAVKRFEIFAVDENWQILKDTKTTICFNKSSANEPNPEPESAPDIPVPDKNKHKKYKKNKAC
jgi:hypothetical protein